ncbi:hypothetical protein VTJ04DRAFT_7903 [Mycothermus thermophilus]|uniref:uncharacterized protein n=1 Tax=Humicola insolens TaxID=85995 RepID=UPI0037448B14
MSFPLATQFDLAKRSATAVAILATDIAWRESRLTQCKLIMIERLWELASCLLRLGYPVLEALCNNNQDTAESRKLVEDISSSLKAFVASDQIDNSNPPKNWVKAYFRFRRSFLVKEDRLGSQLPRLTQPLEQPDDENADDTISSDVCDTLYNVFVNYCQVDTGSEPPGYPAWLCHGKLGLSFKLVKPDAVFDAVFMKNPIRTPDESIRWQQVQFFIPR